jgi:hypothetical protein|tara:strand:- start:253 stop:453 length:201 start_codon:yes stop_codon:yes gene_type:complete
MKPNVWGINIYTKTVTEGRDRKMWGVIEAPIDKMLRGYPDEFKFIRHETRRSLDGERAKRNSKITK